MNDNKIEKTINVTVQYRNDGSGNVGNGRYQADCDQYTITVGKKNTTIIYKLTADTPAPIIFTGYSADVQGQLGKATISDNGRTISMNDADSGSEPQLIKVTLLFADTFGYDPEVQNVPDPGL